MIAAVEYMTLAQAARLSPGRPHSGTVLRWIRQGVNDANGRRVFLAGRKIGGSWFVTEADMEAFAMATTADRGRPTMTTGKTRRSPRPKSGHDRAMQSLAAKGLV